MGAEGGILLEQEGGSCCCSLLERGKGGQRGGRYAGFASDGSSGTPRHTLHFNDSSNTQQQQQSPPPSSRFPSPGGAGLAIEVQQVFEASMLFHFNAGLLRHINDYLHWGGGR